LQSLPLVLLKPRVKGGCIETLILRFLLLRSYWVLLQSVFLNTVVAGIVALDVWVVIFVIVELKLLQLVMIGRCLRRTVDRLLIHLAVPGTQKLPTAGMEKCSAVKNEKSL
jgi:hypothetical protein